MNLYQINKNNLATLKEKSFKLEREIQNKNISFKTFNLD